MVLERCLELSCWHEQLGTPLTMSKKSRTGFERFSRERPAQARHLAKRGAVAFGIGGNPCGGGESSTTRVAYRDAGHRAHGLNRVAPRSR